ncbi:hypothetical protein DEIPH_ctg092orf0004 [Deinococcus phoenicis]|uniref:Uncharacterized protein n=1 Tax=Deinococcus phoenicis TaxID=1476583 RepID=A0A016QLG0_9DEIO|nr:hypothetical protein [Deinococcus phoenicis]EYB66589.1 hypothetical protein DEIPH_ctg092orf0004 [Deinococcus phoenicis]
MNTHAISTALQARIGNVLTVSGLKAAAKAAAQLAKDLLPGATGVEKAAYAERWLLLAVEEYDNKIPVLGRYLDLPLADRLEAAAVRAAVAWGYAAIESGEAVADPIDPASLSGGTIGSPTTPDDFGPSMGDVPPGRR